MNEQEKAERFNRQLDRLINDQSVSFEDLSQDERDALEMSHLLLNADFSAESKVQDPLRTRLVEKSTRRRYGFNLPALFHGLAWGAAGLTLVLLLSWTIRSLLPRPAVTQPVVAQTNTPNSVPLLADITPSLVQAANIRNIYWSPDGTWLGFLAQNEEQFKNSPGGEGYLPPAEGTVHFVNLPSGESCQYAMNNPEGFDFYRWYAASPSSGTWLVIGRAGEIFQLPHPCAPGERRQVNLPGSIDGVYPLTSSSGSFDQDNYLFVGTSTCWLYNTSRSEVLSIEECSREASLSPEDSYLGMTLTADSLAHRTLIIDTGSGEPVFDHSWTFSDGGLGSLPAPIWLSELEFIIYRSDEGPLLVSLAPETAISHIADELIGIPGAVHQYAYGQATTDGNYHIILNDFGADYTHSTVYIYHNESGEVEALPEGTRFLSFYPDGNTLEIEQVEIVDGYEQSSRYTRPLDPPRAPLEPYTPVVAPSGSAASPDGSLRVEITPAQITPGYHLDVVTAEDESYLYHWLIQGYEPERFSWSPHGNALAAIASDFESGSQAIYLLKFNQP